MPTAPLGKCTQPACPNRTDRGGRCLEHRRTADRQTKQRQTWRPYSDERWGPLRDLVLAEQPFCANRDGRPSTAVDHIVPVREQPALAFYRPNLQGLCQSCHSKKTAAENDFGGRPQ